MVIQTKVDTSQVPQQNVVDANSGGPDNHNMIKKTHLYKHCW